MVQYPADYLFKKHLLSALRPSLQKYVLHRGITAGFSSIQEILEKSKDIKDSSWYDIGLRIVQEDTILHHSAYRAALRTYQLMLNLSHKPPGFMSRPDKSIAGSKLLKEL